MTTAIEPLTDLEELQALNAELADIELPELHKQREAWNNALSRIKGAREAIVASIDNKPRVADVLPNDIEAVRWSKHHDGLNLRLDQLKAEMNLLPDPDILQHRLSEVHARLNHLEYVEQNLLNAIEGRSGKSWILGGDGVSAVR